MGKIFLTHNIIQKTVKMGSAIMSAGDQVSFKKIDHNSKVKYSVS